MVKGANSCRYKSSPYGILRERILAVIKAVPMVRGANSCRYKSSPYGKRSEFLPL